jgi:hypothetical protein
LDVEGVRLLSLRPHPVLSINHLNPDRQQIIRIANSSARRHTLPTSMTTWLMPIHGNVPNATLISLKTLLAAAWHGAGGR